MTASKLSDVEDQLALLNLKMTRLEAQISSLQGNTNEIKGGLDKIFEHTRVLVRTAHFVMKTFGKSVAEARVVQAGEFLLKVFGRDQELRAAESPDISPLQPN
jgi:hypothetical protein